MADKVPKFEHYARETRKTLKEFVNNPEDVDMQLELFTLLQVTGRLYKEIGRRFGTTAYGGSAGELRESAKEAIRYLPRTSKRHSLQRDIKYYLNLLGKEYTCHDSKIKSRSLFDKIAG